MERVRTFVAGPEVDDKAGLFLSDPQSPIPELSSSSSSTTDLSSTSTTGTKTAATSTDCSLATLEKSFDTVFAERWYVTSNSDALSKFLQSLAASLEGAPSPGNVLSTEA